LRKRKKKSGNSRGTETQRVKTIWENRLVGGSHGRLKTVARGKGKNGTSGIWGPNAHRGGEEGSRKKRKSSKKKGTSEGGVCLVSKNTGLEGNR